MNHVDQALPLRAFLDNASRRLVWLAALRGATAGLGLALATVVALAILQPERATRDMIGTAVLLAAIGLLLGATVAVLRRRGNHRVAFDIERRAPECRNIVITAAELLDAPERVEPYVGEVVRREATAKVAALDPAILFPARHAFAAFGALLIAWTLTLAIAASRDRANAPIFGATSSATAARVDQIDVVVTPPVYSGQPVQNLRDPVRIEALAGSRIELSIKAIADTIGLETLSGRQTLPVRDRRAIVVMQADADGFIAVEASSAGRAGARRLIGLSVTPDHPPRVRITAPGKDMFLSDAKRTIPVTIETDDDIGLGSLSLRYTRVSGSGERFTFIEGEVPLAVTRSDGRRWSARGELKLAALALEQGDMLVYRGVATDKRPGAAPTESDAFLVEITSPGMIAAEGFALDDQQDKYALSQQMVILKTERLIARSAGLSPESLTYHSQMIAAEQRAVRAEFVFMMGGEVAEEVIAAAGLTDINEEAEAANEADLGAGRMVNRGRIALVQSIRWMSRASTALNEADPVKALPQEKAALVALQQAFSRTRYLLRALTQRERLDLSRRLTGVLAAASRDVRTVGEPVTNPKVVALRRALAGIATLAGTPEVPADATSTTSRLAQSVLEVDPSALPLQKVAADLDRAAVAIGQSNRSDDARRLLDSVATQLAAILRAEMLLAPESRGSAELNAMQGALADALRRGRGGR